MMRPYRTTLLPSLGTTVVLSLIVACSSPIGENNNGGDADPPPTFSCEEMERRPTAQDSACGESQRFVKGGCYELRCDAEEGLADNCCPGQVCTTGGSCIVPPARYDTCNSDADCDPGMSCLNRPMITTESKTCGWLPVESGGCPHGGQPFNGRCVFGAPCGASCPAGAVCNIDTNACEKTPSLPTTNHGCDQTCFASEILVYSDPDTMLFDACCEIKCKCLTLPPLEPGNWGRYSDAVLAENELLVSAYDSTYGDLVLATANLASGHISSVAYIDGVPSSGDIVADPAGPRGGLDGSGPDVGQYTSLALDSAGSPRIVYRDVEKKALKLAAWNVNDGVWDLSFIDHGSPDPAEVDDQDLDVGRFTSLVVDANNLLHIAYFAANAHHAGTTITTPMYARSTTELPSGPDDWQTAPVEAVPSCSAACNPEQACVLSTGQPTCLPPAIGCNPLCQCDETCVDDGGPNCRVTLPNTIDIPCDASCADEESCVDDTLGDTECLKTLGDPCGGCGKGKTCISDENANTVCHKKAPVACDSGCAWNQSCVDDSLVRSKCLPTLEMPCGSCEADELCVEDGSGAPVCREEVSAGACPGGCDTDESCVASMTGGVECLPTLLMPCEDNCESGQLCVEGDAEGTPTCFDPGPVACDPICGPTHSCVDDTLKRGKCMPAMKTFCGVCEPYRDCVEDGTTSDPVCRDQRPYSVVEGLANGVGLFTSMVLHVYPALSDEPRPTLVYYDRVRRGLRGARALFDASGDPSSGFEIFPIACGASQDFGQHASLTVAPDNTLGMAFQGGGGETLSYFKTTGANLQEAENATPVPVDVGIRGTQIHLVGASADLAFTADGVPWVLYADQTENDLLLAYKPNDSGTWSCRVLLKEGAFGSFARLLPVGETAHVTSYLRNRNESGHDKSAVVVKKIGLDNASLDALTACWP